MRGKGIRTIALCFLGTTVAFGQGQSAQEGAKPSLQAARDPGEAAVLATCKNPPPKPRGPAGFRRPQQAAFKAGPATAIPGVVAAGAQWKLVWQSPGNNADGIIAAPDGGILIAQNDKSDVLQLAPDSKTSVVYTNTHTGGALSRNTKGALFVNGRGLRARVIELAPSRKVLADKYQGDSLDCVGGVLNDLTAASNGGVYFTEGGLLYASPSGKVTKYGENLRTNGIILSPDEKTLYVTNGMTLAAFDVQPDGSLTNQREFAKLEAGGSGDGSTIDAEGRIYVSTGAGVQVFSPKGKFLGLIPIGPGLISVAFSGPNKKTLYAVVYSAATGDRIYTISMIAQGFKKRAK